MSEHASRVAGASGAGEDVIVAAAARLLGRPVRWISSRVEDFQASMHGREAVTEGQVAVTVDGRMLGVRARTVANLGAYLMKYGAGPVQRMTLFPTGAYAIAHLEAEAIGAFTNTTPTGPYRGAGRPEAAFFAERMADAVAVALGLDPADVRRRNFIPPDAFPYTTAGGVTYDSGDYAASLELALARVDYPRLRELQAERRARGELVGVGLASTVELSGGGSENGEVTVEANGSVSAITGTSPHGQGLVTTFAQLVADQLGLAPDQVAISYGDTDSGGVGGGTMSSRSGTLGGNAIRAAATMLRDKLVEAAARMLEVAPTDLVVREGAVSVSGAVDRRATFGGIVVSLGGGPLTSRVAFGNDGGDTFPFGTTVVVVSIDRETAGVHIEQFVAVDDCGKVLNPLILEGQLVGGAVRGIGEALLEQVSYDADGALIAGSLMDYAVPTAAKMPHFDLVRTETPSPRNPLGMKGVGESGTVSAPPAVTNAVLDALQAQGISCETIELPMTSERIWQLLSNARRPERG